MLQRSNGQSVLLAFSYSIRLRDTPFNTLEQYNPASYVTSICLQDTSLEEIASLYHSRLIRGQIAEQFELVKEALVKHRWREK
jgi:hypothetical protein